jgi:hypothetical protein
MVLKARAEDNGTSAHSFAAYANEMGHPPRLPWGHGHPRVYLGHPSIAMLGSGQGYCQGKQVEWN